MRGDSGAAQGFQDERLVALRGAQQDGDLVEGHALGGRGVDGAGDLDALQGFAGSGEDDDAAIFLAHRDGVAGEEVSLQRVERRGAGFGLPVLFCGREVQLQRHARRAHHGGEQFALQARAGHKIERDDGRLAQAL